MKIVQRTTNRDNGAGGNDTAIRVDTAASSLTTTWRGSGKKGRRTTVLDKKSRVCVILFPRYLLTTVV